MIVAMQESATEEQIDAVIDVIVESGLDVHRTTGATQTILAGVGPATGLDLTKFELLPGVLSRSPNHRGLQAGRTSLSSRKAASSSFPTEPRSAASRSRSSPAPAPLRTASRSSQLPNA